MTGSETRTKEDAGLLRNRQMRLSAYTRSSLKTPSQLFSPMFTASLSQDEGESCHSGNFQVVAESDREKILAVILAVRNIWEMSH